MTFGDKPKHDNFVHGGHLEDSRKEEMIPSSEMNEFINL
jgi:hypothetical protein